MGIFETEVDISKYIELYNLGTPIRKMKPITNQTYKVLSLSNSDIRIIDRDKFYQKLFLLKKIEHFIKDTKEHSNRFFYMIPLQTPSGTIVGFILRSVFSKNYASVYRASNYSSKVPYMYGFYKDFEKIDSHKSCVPIVICEGLKDCILMKKIYPYVLSNNTSSLGLNANVLRNISNKFLLVYDNDETGIPSTKSDKTLLRSMGCFVDSIQIEDDIVSGTRYKDVSDLLDNPTKFNDFKKTLVKKITYLKNN